MQEHTGNLTGMNREISEKALHKRDHLAGQIRNTQAFFAPDNLADLIVKYEGEIALLVIDVQEQFCDPAQRGNKQTVKISERIQSLVPEFRKANIPVYAIYYSAQGEKPAEQVDFYKFTPDKDDIIVAKDGDSAFMSSNIMGMLDKQSRKLLLVCGFNEAACVKRTVLDARSAGFQVCVLSDLTGNDNNNSGAEYQDDARYAMKRAGTVRASSQAVLSHLGV